MTGSRHLIERANAEARQAGSSFERFWLGARTVVGRWSPGSPLPYLALLTVIWLGFLVLLFLLQVFGTGMGLRVWPMGEDHTWIELLWRNGLLGAPSGWWVGHGRNPLAPWWTVVTAPLVLGFDYGIYLVRKPLDLLCAAAVFLLLFQLGRGRYPLFAFACALLTLLWNFSGYLEQSIWPYIAALGLSTVSIWAYCRFLDSGRHAPYDLALGLVLYLIVIATYTLQASALLAVPFLAVVRGDGRDRLRSWRRVGLAALDTALFGSVLALFMAIWIATRPPATDAYFALSPGRFVDQAVSSLRNLVWHDDYGPRLLSAFTGWHPAAIALTLLGGIGVFGALLWRLGRNDPGLRRDAAGGIKPAAPAPSLAATVGQTLGVALSLAAATIVVETTSAPGVWPPGTRATMIQQEWQPLLYGAVLFGAALLIARHRPRAAQLVAVGGMAALSAGALLAGLDYNRTLNQNTAMEQRLEAGLKDLLPTVTEPVYIIVKPEGVDMWYWTNLSHTYAQTYYRSSLVNLHVLVPGEPVQQLSSHFDVVFGTDAQGMLSAPFGGQPIRTPYDQVMFVRFDGQTVSLLETVSLPDVSGFRVGWDRLGPITQSFDPHPSTGCPQNVDFDDDVSGRGWSVPEVSPDGTSLTWTTATVATLDLGVAVNRPFELEARILQGIAPDVLASLRVSVNGQELPLRTAQDADGATIVRVSVPETALAANEEPTEVAFMINRTVVPEGGKRTLGLAFDYVHFDCDR